MKTVRFGTFETNSSSAHVATICGQKKLEEYKAHKVICVFDFYYSEDDCGDVNVVPDKAFKSFEKVLSDIKEYYENPDIEDKDEEYMETAKKLLDGGFTAKDLENCLVNEGSFGDIDDWEIHELLEEGVYSDDTLLAMALEAGIILLVAFCRIVLGMLGADLVIDVATALAQTVGQGEAYVTPILINGGDVSAAGYKAVNNFLHLCGEFVFILVFRHRLIYILASRHCAFHWIFGFNTCRQSLRLASVNTLVCWIRPLLNGEFLLYILFFVHFSIVV